MVYYPELMPYFATSNNKQQHKGTKNSSEVQKY